MSCLSKGQDKEYHDCCCCCSVSFEYFIAFKMVELIKALCAVTFDATDFEQMGCVLNWKQ